LKSRPRLDVSQRLVTFLRSDEGLYKTEGSGQVIVSRIGSRINPVKSGRCSSRIITGPSKKESKINDGDSFTESGERINDSSKFLIQLGCELGERSNISYTLSLKLLAESVKKTNSSSKLCELWYGSHI